MTSPLAEVQVESLQALFNKNPKDLTDEDILKVCEILRAQKGVFDEEETKPKTRRKAMPEVELKDLGL